MVLYWDLYRSCKKQSIPSNASKTFINLISLTNLVDVWCLQQATDRDYSFFFFKIT